jgi:hypothetical protein
MGNPKIQLFLGHRHRPAARWRSQGLDNHSYGTHGRLQYFRLCERLWSPTNLLRRPLRAPALNGLLDRLPLSIFDVLHQYVERSFDGCRIFSPDAPPGHHPPAPRVFRCKLCKDILASPPCTWCLYWWRRWLDFHTCDVPGGDLLHQTQKSCPCYLRGREFPWRLNLLLDSAVIAAKVGIRLGDESCGVCRYGDHDTSEFLAETETDQEEQGTADRVECVSRADLCLLFCRHVFLYGGDVDSCFLRKCSCYFPSFCAEKLQLGSFGRDIIHIATKDASSLLLIINGVGVLGRVIPAIVAARFGPLNLMIPLSLVSGLILFCWAGVSTHTEIIIFDVFYGFIMAAAQGMFPPSLGSLTDDLSKMGVRMGMVFSLCGFAVLIGNPLAGALITLDGGRYLYAQMFAGAAMTLGVWFLMAARVLKSGWSLQARV